MPPKKIGSSRALSLSPTRDDSLSVTSNRSLSSSSSHKPSDGTPACQDRDHQQFCIADADRRQSQSRRSKSTKETPSTLQSGSAEIIGDRSANNTPVGDRRLPVNKTLLSSRSDGTQPRSEVVRNRPDISHFPMTQESM